jgi:hypothetical protein
MLVPALGFVLSAAFFALVGAGILPRGGVRPVRPPVLAAFVVAAQVGVIAFAAASGFIFAGAEDQLRDPGTIVGFLVGMPIAGSLCGLLVARWLASRRGERT